VVTGLCPVLDHRRSVGEQEREGHEFTRAVRSLRMCRALAPEVSFVSLADFFRNIFSR
jgi:hypothetical protein